MGDRLCRCHQMDLRSDETKRRLEAKVFEERVALIKWREELQRAKYSLEEVERQEEQADREVDRIMAERDKANNEIDAKRDAAARALVNTRHKKQELETAEKAVRDAQTQYNSLKRLLDEKEREVDEKKKEISSKQREAENAVPGAV